MKSDGIFKQAIAVFIVALGIYIVTYHAIEDRRTRHGPWQIAFTNDAANAPAVLINQPRLAITNVLIVFSGGTKSVFTNQTSFDFTMPHPTPFEVPFGKCVFMDTTSLPGTIVLEMFGHEIQLMPRVLTIDGVEQRWMSPTEIILKAATNSISETVK